MTSSAFYHLLKSEFPFKTTAQQDIALEQLSQFVTATSPDQLYLLKGKAKKRRE